MKKFLVGFLALGTISSFASDRFDYEVKDGDRVILLESSRNTLNGNSMGELIDRCDELNGSLLASAKCSEVDVMGHPGKCYQICKY